MSIDPDARFERALLESARSDANPPDVSDAWTRFAETLALAVPRAARGRGDAAGDLAPRAAAAGVKGARAGALRWLLIGALGGAVPTAVLVLRHRPAVMVAPADAVGTARSELGVGGARALAPASASSSGAPPTPEAPRATSGTARPTTSPRRHAAPANAAVRLCRAGDERGTAPEAPGSTLSAEVSRIDTARTASALGDYDEAVRLIDHYHRDFPRGALGADADVVALEAVAARRDQPEVARRAALFLARYPNDPHAARVRALAGAP
jgi:hypothetical protein